MAKRFNSNDTVNEFYKTLKLGSEIHRLDYLLMSMIGLQKNLPIGIHRMQYWDKL